MSTILLGPKATKHHDFFIKSAKRGKKDGCLCVIVKKEKPDQKQSLQRKTK